MREKRASDFRYDTGDTKVPWDAVAEKPDKELLMDMVRFLIGEGADPSAYRAALSDVDTAIGKLCECGKPVNKLSLGEKVSEVEEKAKTYLNVKHACFLVNWTAGFDIALDMVGVKEGDEVIVPAITFIASASPVIRKGAKIVFADIDPETINMDPKDVERKITSKTKAIVPVHIGGYPVDMDSILDLARSHDIPVVEDAAHAYGATYKGRKIGSLSDFTSFSFHEVKNINSLGEGGLLVTNNDLGQQFAKTRFLGFDTESPPPETWLYNISPIRSKDGFFAATNYSTTEIQAVALLRHMQRNDDIIDQRRWTAERLHRAFKDVDGLLPGKLWDNDFGAIYHLFLLRVDPEVIGGGVQAFKKGLTDKGVTQIPHFCPLYHYNLFETFGYDREAIRQSCPNAERAFFDEYTHLPLYGLSEEQITYMIDAVVDTARELKR